MKRQPAGVSRVAGAEGFGDVNEAESEMGIVFGSCQVGSNKRCFWVSPR